MQNSSVVRSLVDMTELEHIPVIFLFMHSLSLVPEPKLFWEVAPGTQNVGRGFCIKIYSMISPFSSNWIRFLKLCAWINDLKRTFVLKGPPHPIHFSCLPTKWVVTRKNGRLPFADVQTQAGWESVRQALGDFSSLNSANSKIHFYGGTEGRRTLGRCQDKSRRNWNYHGLLASDRAHKQTSSKGKFVSSFREELEHRLRSQADMVGLLRQPFLPCMD